MGRYTHGHHESVLRSHRRRDVGNSAGYLAAHLTSGASLLDVGCGPGTLTVDLARHVAPGRVVGIDRSDSIVELATADRPGDVANLEFRVGNVYALDFDDGTFDIVHAHQVLQHLDDPVAALREMGRVCRQGGVVAARDADYEAMTWHPHDDRLEQWLATYRAVVAANGGQPDAGRYLLAWAHEAGFAQVEPSASVWCFATSRDRTWWGGLWSDRIVESAFADYAIESGRATRSDLDAMSAGWSSWAANRDGWFAVVHGEIICPVL